MLDMDVPVGAGTDATRVATYNPWIALYWLVTGKTLGGLRLTPERNTLDRETALHLWTKGSAWFSGDEEHKGALRVGEFADLAVLSDDYFSVPAEDIKNITSVLTMLGGRIVHGSGEFANLAPPLPPASPDWSPVRTYGGYAASGSDKATAKESVARKFAMSCGCATFAVFTATRTSTPGQAGCPSAMRDRSGERSAARVGRCDFLLADGQEATWAN
jgi:hypothetical protein